jgi:hypothetical protein
VRKWPARGFCRGRGRDAQARRSPGPGHTVKKSMAAIAPQCALRKELHDVRLPRRCFGRTYPGGVIEVGPTTAGGFARLYCATCKHSQLVAFSCKGRGFCPSCLGRRMCATAANLVERVLPDVDLRQWVLTFPFAWRRRLAQDGALLGTLTRLFVATVQRFYAERIAARSCVSRHDAKSGRGHSCPAYVGCRSERTARRT